MYSSTDPYPLALLLSPPLPDVVILVTNAGPSQNDDITSTLNFAQEYVLGETLIECIATSALRSSIMIAGTRGIRNITILQD